MQFWLYALSLECNLHVRCDSTVYFLAFKHYQILPWYRVIEMGRICSMGVMKNTINFYLKTSDWYPMGRPSHRWEDNTKRDPIGIRWWGLDYIDLGYGHGMFLWTWWWVFRFLKSRESLDGLFTSEGTPCTMKLVAVSITFLNWIICKVKRALILNSVF
jgi:hypothetical protein